MTPVLQRNDARKQQYELHSPATTLGRHPDCEIVVEVGAVSRRHAKIVAEGTEFFLEDLKSRNGTFLNDRQIGGRQRISHGDEIRVCEVSFTFLSKEAAAGDTPSSKTLRSDSVVIDDKESEPGVISKLDISLTSSGIQVTASPKAKLEALLKITHALGRAISMEEVAPQVLEGLFSIFMQADRAFIIMPDDQGELMPRWSKFRREDEGETRISRTVLRMAMEKKEAILTADAANDKRFDMSESINNFAIRSFMCAPLINSEEEVIGVLHVDNMSQGKRFQSDDLELLAAVAVQAGLAIDNAQLYERTMKQREIEYDLEVAFEVQKSLLPTRSPEVQGFEFYDFYKPASGIGGDYYDYILLPNNRLVVVVADVVGHGIAAALLVSKLSAEMKFALGAETDLAKVAERVNTALLDLEVEKFVTCLLMMIDLSTFETTIVNAGHMAPLWKKADGSLQEPGDDLAGLPLGVVHGMTYRTCEIQLSPGDMLLAYTDGVNECMDKNGVQFGIDRLRNRMHESKKADMKSVGERIMSDVRTHLGAGAQDDDMCLVGLRIT